MQKEEIVPESIGAAPSDGRMNGQKWRHPY